MLLHVTRIGVYLKTFLLFSLFLEFANAEYRVELVQVVFRHGDRTPSRAEMYPKLPYDPSIFNSTGFGQLTSMGKRRLYNFGKMLNRMYADLLGDTVNAGDIYAYSTDFERTKMSLQLVLLGLKPEMSNESFHTQNWLPVPMLYSPLPVDNVLVPQLCPMYQEKMQNVRNSSGIRKKLLKYNDFFEFITENTGLNVTSNPVRTMWKLYHLLQAEESMNITSPPEWVNEDVKKKLEELTKLEYEIRSYTPDMKRLYGGAIIKRFIKNMNLDRQRDKIPKLYLYGAHEVNIAGLAKAHNFDEPEIPSYASAIIFEKLRNSNDEEFVRMLLWTGVTEKLIPYNLPGSDKNRFCPLDKYLKFVKDVIPTDPESNCLWDTVTKEQLRDYCSQERSKLRKLMYSML